MRLVPQDTVQAVHRQAPIDPSAHRVDVEHAQRIERPAVPPQVVQAFGAFEARTEQRRRACGSERGRASHPLPTEPVEEHHEGDVEGHRVRQQDLLEADRRTHLTVFGGRQQVREPVIVQVIVAMERIDRRHVALRELGSHRHPPDEVGGEIGAIGLAAVGQLAGDARERPGDNAGSQDDEDADRHHVGGPERRRRQRPAQRHGTDGQNPTRHERSDQQRRATDASRPQDEQDDAAGPVAPDRPDEDRGEAAPGPDLVDEMRENDARQREPGGNQRQQQAVLQRHEAPQRHARRGYRTKDPEGYPQGKCSPQLLEGQGNDLERSERARQYRAAQPRGASIPRRAGPRSRLVEYWAVELPAGPRDAHPHQVSGSFF